MAEINASQIAGNVLVISALVGQSDDSFKIHQLLFGCPGATPTPTPAVGITTSPNSITFTGVAGGPNPALIYDYYGLPKETYESTYPAPGFRAARRPDPAA